MQGRTLNKNSRTEKPKAGRHRGSRKGDVTDQTDALELDIPLTVTEHDAFICHASEDKDAVARPLAKFLVELGLSVWFDEFSLETGDSLSRAIDQGLASSRFGVVIISKAFFRKGWPKHELSGLWTKEISTGKAILPVWHEVTAHEVRRFSLPLADKVAVETASSSIQQIGLKLLNVISPDRANALARWLLWRKLIDDSPTRLVSLADLKKGPVVHAALPESLLVRIHLIHGVLADAGVPSLATMIANFRRDVDPAREVLTWERIAASYLVLAKRRKRVNKRAIFTSVLKTSFLDRAGAESVIDGTDELAIDAVKAWCDVAIDPSDPSQTRRDRP
jgi:hypothetical protein